MEYICSIPPAGRVNLVAAARQTGEHCLFDYVEDGGIARVSFGEYDTVGLPAMTESGHKRHKMNVVVGALKQVIETHKNAILNQDVKVALAIDGAHLLLCVGEQNFRLTQTTAASAADEFSFEDDPIPPRPVVPECMRCDFAVGNLWETDLFRQMEVDVFLSELVFGKPKVRCNSYDVDWVVLTIQTSEQTRVHYHLISRRRPVLHWAVYYDAENAWYNLYDNSAVLVLSRWIRLVNKAC